MIRTCVIRGASWVVAWDPVSRRHEYVRDVDIVFCGNRFEGIVDSYQGGYTDEIDGTDYLIIPGLVNVHSHPASEPLRKGITDETRSPGFHHSSLFEFLSVFDNDGEGRVAALQVAICELLKSGCTTFTDLSSPYDGWLDILGETGIRAVVAPGFRDARWFTRNGHSLEYEWDLAAGREGFDAAVELITQAERHPTGRLSGMVYPAQLDTCSPELLRDSFDYAAQKQLPWQTHAAQSMTEFQELHRRHGRTPIQWMENIGVLGPHSVLGHAIFLDHHPWLHWTTRTDLETLSRQGVSVAHCPTVFSRRGIALRTFGSYRRAGINLGLGTDTYPHNFLEEMRTALSHARLIAQTVDDLNTSDVFDAATIGGARALQRDDIGRIAPGCKADFAMIDLTHPSMRPMREPLRSLLYVAAERAVDRVYVDGAMVVENGEVTTIDYENACGTLEEAQRRSLTRTAELDWAGRNAEQLSPMVYPVGNRP